MLIADKSQALPILLDIAFSEAEDILCRQLNISVKSLKIIDLSLYMIVGSGYIIIFG